MAASVPVSAEPVRLTVLPVPTSFVSKVVTVVRETSSLPTLVSRLRLLVPINAVAVPSYALLFAVNEPPMVNGLAVMFAEATGAPVVLSV